MIADGRTSLGPPTRAKRMGLDLMRGLPGERGGG
jgi:hypothetical protein